MSPKISGGLVHEVTEDLVRALTETEEIMDLWEKLTPLHAASLFAGLRVQSRTRLELSGLIEPLKNFSQVRNAHVVGLVVFIAPIKNPADGSKTF